MINGQHSVAETDKKGEKLILVSTPPKKPLWRLTAQVLPAASLLRRGIKGLGESERGMARVGAGTKMFCRRACTHFALGKSNNAWMNLCGGKWPVAIEKKQKDKQTNKQTTKTKLLTKKAWLFLGCVRLGNLDLDFKIRISDLQWIVREIWKWISTISVFGFAFLLFDWEIRKNWFEKLSLRTAVLHAHAQLAKWTPLFTKAVLRILFRISQSNGKKEVYEIRIWIS